MGTGIGRIERDGILKELNRPQVPLSGTRRRSLEVLPDAWIGVGTGLDRVREVPEVLRRHPLRDFIERGGPELGCGLNMLNVISLPGSGFAGRTRQASNEKRTLNGHGSDSEIASFHLIGKLVAIACQAASRLLPERQMIDLEANQRQKILRAGFDAPVAADFVSRKMPGWIGSSPVFASSRGWAK